MTRKLLVLIPLFVIFFVLLPVGGRLAEAGDHSSGLESHLLLGWGKGLAQQKVASTPDAPLGWQIETIDSVGMVGAYTSLALDGSGYPHISYPYWQWPNGDLKYAYQDAAGWHIETITSTAILSTYTSLALDGSGYPHISYFDWTTKGALKYAHQEAAGWYIETVDNDASAGGHNSLVLDADGYPHISYSEAISIDLKYAYQDAAGWHIETVDSAGYVGSNNSLALDGSGYPHISYFDNTNEALKYAYQDAAGWFTEIVTGAGVWGDTSLALDGSGYPHIGYYDTTNTSLKYAYQDAAGWHIETVDSAGWVGRSPSLSIDAGGYPHISYHEGTNFDLKYAYQDAAGWHIETVDSAENVGLYTSLALDAGGYPHISYYDSTNYDLKYAYWGDNTPPAAITDLEANTGSTSGTVDLTWTAPGDDGDTGIASTYIVRYNTVQITDANWNSSTDVTGEPTPSPTGSPEAMTVSGLTPGQTYYFAIKSQDEVPNTSGISNSPSAVAKSSGGTTTSYTYLPVTMRNYSTYFQGPWEAEPNNTFSQANGPLIAGRDYFGYPDQYDLFKILLRTNGRITVDLLNHTGVGTTLALYDESQTLVDQETPSHLTYQATSGWYYVYIYASGGYNNQNPFTLRVTYP